jgi:glycosyltransferase involved in cell wall biosynthesis
LILDNNISVIIPVYNAADFVAKAVESALSQPETAEIILIEDGSKDNSLEICRDLAARYNKVKLYTHTGNSNKGAGLSRNLGIEKASGDFIAFLDADDFYLPNRFRAERKIFAEKTATDGVYGALGFHYYSEDGRVKYQKSGFEKLTTVSAKVAPNELFLAILWLHDKACGYFHLDTLTIKRDVFFGKTDLFNNLALHEDTVFIIQLSLNCLLEPGIIDEAVGLRGVHNNNRIVNNPGKSDSRLMMWQYLYNWSIKKSKRKEVTGLFEAFMITEKIGQSKRLPAFSLLWKYSFSNRNFLLRSVFFNASCVRVFGKRIAGIIFFVKYKVQARVVKTKSTLSFQV